MSAKGQRVRIEAPAGMDRLELVEHVAGDAVLAKARRKYNTRTFRRDRAVDEISQRFAAAYDLVLDRMFEALTRFVGEKILGGQKLGKSNGFVDGVDWPSDELVAFASAQDPADPNRQWEVERKLSLLTPAQLETLKGIIRDYHYAFAVGVLGPDALPVAEVQRLMGIGLVPEDLAFVLAPQPGKPSPPPSLRVTDLAYQYGQQLATPEREDVKQLGADEFVAHLERTRESLNPVERQAMAFARFNAGEHIRGMADRFVLETGTLIRNADAEQRRRYLGTVQRELEDNIDKRDTWRKLASEIGHATKDWSRDMQRVAATEKQFAMQEGQARQIAKGHEDPDDARVAKIPAPDACPDCIRLHLTAGRGSPPRIFKLSELQANGTNVGRKRQDWQPTVGPVHPWCGCELVEVPEGWAFDEEGNMLPESMLEGRTEKAEPAPYALASLDRLDRCYLVLRKAQEDAQKPHMTHRDAVPTDTLIVRVSDPQIRQVVEAVVAEAPREIFAKDVGVTLITTDIPRVQNPLEDHDYAYWSANEIRLNQNLPVERVPRVLRHELGHSLNVYLIRQLGGVDEVRAWHDQLWKISLEEGFVSDYARKLPIENAAEATRFYLFERPKLMLGFPSTFAFLHRHYRPIFNR